MFSADPSFLTRKDKFTKEELKRAVRGALAAEIDAINYYFQQGDLINDPRLKSAHEDIAKEEMTHFGEFLRMLYEVSPDEFLMINKGWDEASRIIGKVDFPIKIKTGEEEKVKEIEGESGSNEPTLWAMEGIKSTFRQKVKNVEYGSDTISIAEIDEDEGAISQGGSSFLYHVPYLSLEFRLRDSSPSNWKEIAFNAGKKFSILEDTTLLKAHELSPLKIGGKVSASDWDQPGSILNDVVKAYEYVSKGGFDKVIVMISPALFSKLFRVVDRTGTYEHEVVRRIGEIVVSPALDREIIVLSPDGFEVAVRKQLKVEFLDKDKEYEIYLISEQISPRPLSRLASCSVVKET
jgi:rubrerythrin